MVFCIKFAFTQLTHTINMSSVLRSIQHNNSNYESHSFYCSFSKYLVIISGSKVSFKNKYSDYHECIRKNATSEEEYKELYYSLNHLNFKVLKFDTKNKKVLLLDPFTTYNNKLYYNTSNEPTHICSIVTEDKSNLTKVHIKIFNQSSVGCNVTCIGTRSNRFCDRSGGFNGYCTLRSCQRQSTEFNGIDLDKLLTYRQFLTLGRSVYNVFYDQKPLCLCCGKSSCPASLPITYEQLVENNHGLFIEQSIMRCKILNADKKAIPVKDIYTLDKVKQVLTDDDKIWLTCFTKTILNVEDHCRTIAIIKKLIDANSSTIFGKNKCFYLLQLIEAMEYKPLKILLKNSKQLKKTTKETFLRLLEEGKTDREVLMVKTAITQYLEQNKDLFEN